MTPLRSRKATRFARYVTDKRGALRVEITGQTYVRISL
jgi:hypothetical protein